MNVYALIAYAHIIFFVALGGFFVFVAYHYLRERLTPPVKKKPRMRWYLQVTLRNGNTYGISNQDYTPVAKPFLHWYFGRPQSEHFMMEYDKGKRLLKRSEIVTFQIEQRISRMTGEVPPG